MAKMENMVTRASKLWLECTCIRLQASGAGHTTLVQLRCIAPAMETERELACQDLSTTPGMLAADDTFEPEPFAHVRHRPDPHCSRRASEFSHLFTRHRKSPFQGHPVRLHIALPTTDAA